MLPRKSEAEKKQLEDIVSLLENGKHINVFTREILADAIRSYLDLHRRVDKVVDYLALPKFNRPENHVNVDDIHLRLSEDF